MRGWGIDDMYITYGVLASSFGLVALLFGNAFNLSEIINQGRLDYYLSLPRPVLLHAVASRTIASGMGDFSYGFLSFALSGQFSWDGLLRFVLATLLAAVVFVSFLILVNSLAFWLGMVSNLAGLALNALVTFGIYPITLFDNYAKLILFTLIPAALMGAVPADFIRGFSWQTSGGTACRGGHLPAHGGIRLPAGAEALRIRQCHPGGSVMGLKEKLFTGLESTRREYRLLVDAVPVERLFRCTKLHFEIHASQIRERSG